MGFSRQEYWSGLPCPSPRHLPDPGIKPGYPALQADSLPSEPPEKLTTNTKGTYIVKKYKQRKKDLQNQPQTIKKMAIGTYISIIALSVNELNAPTQRHGLAEWIQKQDPYI